jgi:hypothetical protein
MCISYLDVALTTSLQNDTDRQTLTCTLIANYLDATQRAPFTKKLLARLSEEMPTWKGNLWKLTRRYEAWLMEALTEEVDRISKAEYKHFFGSLKKAQGSIVRSVALFQNVLDNNVKKALGVNLISPDWVIEVTEPSPRLCQERTYNN